MTDHHHGFVKMIAFRDALPEAGTYLDKITAHRRAVVLADKRNFAEGPGDADEDRAVYIRQAEHTLWLGPNAN